MNKTEAEQNLSSEKWLIATTAGVRRDLVWSIAAAFGAGLLVLLQARLLALVVWPPSGNLHQPNFGACHCREEQHSYREAPILRMELVHRARTCSGMAGSLEGEWVGRDEDGNIAGGFQAIT